MDIKNVLSEMPGTVLYVFYLNFLSVARLTQELEIPGSIPGPATYFISPSAESRRAVVSYWRKYVTRRSKPAKEECG